MEFCRREIYEKEQKDTRPCFSKYFICWSFTWGSDFNSNGGVANIFAADNEDSYIWNHYKAVAPTIDSHGSKEFWANCSVIGDIRLEKPTKGTIKEGVDFSTTDYFKNLDKTDIRYLPKLENVTVTFDSNGGTTVATQTVMSGNAIAEPTAPTRAADEYYDAYTFDGWYLNGEKFNFETIIETDITLVAKWKYGNSKTTYLNNWAKGDFGVENGASIVTIDSAFSNICWGLNGASGVNQELKTQYMAEFGKTDNDGWMLNFNNFETTDKTTGVKTVNRGVISLPKTNLHELLAGGKVATMEVGGGGAWNNIWLAAGGADRKINDNRGNANIVDSLTRTTITIYEDSEGKVHLNYFDRLIAEPRSNNAEYPYGEIVLTDEEANGTASLKLHSSQDGAGRRYWLSKLTVTSGERVYKDFSTKTGFTVDNGTAYTQAESASTGGAPHGQWASIMSPYNLAVGVYGTNKSGPTTLNLDPINFNELFENGEGVRFTLGTWNGTDKISFMNGEETAELGGAEVKPNNHASGNYHDPLKYTWSLIENTWRNWKVSIDRFGMNVHNSYANEDYHFALTEGQLNGTESLTFKLGTYSNDHFFVLTNMMAYHI